MTSQREQVPHAASASVPELIKLRKLTYRELDGSDCDEPCLRVYFNVSWMKDCSEIQSGYNPEPRKQKRHESYEELLDKNFVLAGVGGAGKSTALREIRQRLEAQGKKVYVVSFQNSVAAASNGLTLHMFAAALSGGRIEMPCTVLWDEIFYCPITSLARMVQYFRIPEIQWCFLVTGTSPKWKPIGEEKWYTTASSKTVSSLAFCLKTLFIWKMICGAAAQS